MLTLLGISEVKNHNEDGRQERLSGREPKIDIRYDTIRYDRRVKFNVDSKAEYSALSSTHSLKKETKTNKRQCPFNWIVNWSVISAYSYWRQYI